jgi:hypothetical protein
MECGFAIWDGRADAEGRRRDENSSLPTLLGACIVNIGGGGPFQDVITEIIPECSVGFSEVDIENLRLVVLSRVGAHV